MLSSGLLDWSAFGEGGSVGAPAPPSPTPPTMLTERRRLMFTYNSDIEVLRLQVNLQANLAENHALTNPGIAIGSASKADILVANTVQYVLSLIHI